MLAGAEWVSRGSEMPDSRETYGGGRFAASLADWKPLLAPPFRRETEGASG